MVKFKVISKKVSKNGKQMASLYKDSESLVINAFVIGDTSKLTIGNMVEGEIIYGNYMATFVIR